MAATRKKSVVAIETAPKVKAKKITPNKNQPVLITSTVSTLPEAEEIAGLLLQSKLAGCVNILGPIISIYHWQDKVTKDKEYKLFIKSLYKNWSRIEELIKNNHSYLVPEISLIEISKQHKPYTDWLQSYVELQ